jgi:hypothetical protein
MLFFIGLVILSIPLYFGLSILFTGSSAIPKILETPNVSLDHLEVPVGSGTLIMPIYDESINEVVGKIFSAANLCLFIGLSIVLVYAASVLMGKGVKLIKEVNLKVARKTVNKEVVVEKNLNAGGKSTEE